ncbi:MAG: hypoxanthine phosphoribosyltransferase, partial [Frankiaceae bacterium]|nr:hypoxanthine phosphoribosyltransferase [Frankiaceae bacterium]
PGDRGPAGGLGEPPGAARRLRPFLGLRRADTRAACAAAGLAVWDDPHNLDPRFRRVRIRREVLPLLEDVLGGGAAAALARTAAHLQEDGDALDALAAALLAAGLAPDGSLRLASPAGAPLADQPRALRIRVVRAWLHGAGPSWAAPALTHAHIDDLDRLISQWHGQRHIDLPGGARVQRRSGRLHLQPPQVERPRRSARPVAAIPSGPGTASTPRLLAQPPREPPRVSALDDDIETVLYTQDQIAAKIGELAARVDADYADREPLLVGVLKGAAIFMSDFARALSRPSTMEYMAISSYGSSATSSGVVRILKDLDRNIAGADVLILEDVIDSGLTLSWLMRNLLSRGPATLEVVTLLRKPGAIKGDVPVRYVGFDIPGEFVVGYGLDYAERYRGLPYIGRLRPSVYGR